jgi:two-component system sensor histidine kinase CpxA
MIEQHVEAELANDPPNDLMWWRRLFRAIDKWAPPGQRLLLVTTEGRVIGAERSEMQIIRNFIGQADNADHPQKKKYGRVELVGPFSVRDGEDNYQLYLIRPASSSQSDFINLLFDRPLLLLIVTMLVSTPLLLWLAWSLAKPARKLKNAADEVAQGNLRQHPELEAGPQEFLAAGASFNQMVTALERMMTSQQRLLSDISHELRTPLTTISGYAELLSSGMLQKPEDATEFGRKILAESRRLLTLIEDIIRLSRLDEGVRGEVTPVDLTALIQHCVQKLTPAAQNAQVSISASGNDPVLISGDHALLEEMLTNLLENGIKYNHAGGYVRARAEMADGRAVVTVADNGVGIAPEDQQRVFERFYRVDKSRSKQTGGTGLGLSIVKHGAQVHHAQIAMQSALGEGTTITLTFPAQSSGKK